MAKGNIKRSLILIFLGYSCIYLDKNIISMSVIPMALDLGMNATQKGLILSSFFLGYMLLQIPFGFLGNRIGSRKILISGILLVGILMVSLGFGFSFMYLLVIRFVSGAFAHAGYPSGVSAYVTQEVELEKRGAVQSTMIASSGFAGIIGPLLAAPLITSLGWEKTYYIFGGIVLVIGLFMSKQIPKTSGQPLEYSQQGSISFFSVIKDRNVRVMVLSSFCINGAACGMTGWTASYLVDEFSLTMNQMAVMTALIGLVMMISAIFSGSVIGRRLVGREKQIILSVSILGALGAYSLVKSDSLVLSMILLAISVVAASVGFTTLMSLTVKLFNEHEVATKYSVINSIGVAGGFFAPMIIGWLVNISGSYDGAFSFISISFILTGLISMGIRLKSNSTQ